ncbi:MAG TPA: response regulator transcription factor [Candidatus Acidoferrum sp.]|nr:response regulator transcription factor [Candidatus Acidoferrum sp.]
MKENILIVEDDEIIARFLETLLTAEGFETQIAPDGAKALHSAAALPPDVILLDLGLPDMDGMAVLAQLKNWYGGPVIIVSARERENDKVSALDMGATDYVTKPFGTQELLARVRSALRRKEAAAMSYALDGLVVDFARRIVTVDGIEVHLTQNEYRIVELLAKSPGLPYTYDFIMRSVWGDYIPQDNKILRVNMANIRRKIEQNPAEPRYILTDIGVGYRMAAE